MKLTSEIKKCITLVMIIVTAVMILDIVYQLHMHIRWRWWMPETLLANPTSTQPADTQPADSQPATKPAKKKTPTKSYAVDPAIKRRNIFAKVKPKGHGMKLTGVLGTTAVFADQSGKLVAIEQGKSSKGIKVKLINGYQVTIEYKGKTETMTMKMFSGKQGRPRPGGRAMPTPSRSRPTVMPGGPHPPSPETLRRLSPSARERILKGRPTRRGRRGSRTPHTQRAQ